MIEPGSAEQAGERYALAPRATGERGESGEGTAFEPPASVTAGATEGSTEGSTDRMAAWYGIAVAAARAGVHEQTLRHYERLGLIAPARKGTRPRSPRLYSERDIERVVHIRQLMGDLGVNLAGVEIILSMRERMEGLQRELRQLRRQRGEPDDARGDQAGAGPRGGSDHAYGLEGGTPRR
ncbi:MAG TPA: MerR family transcriptional regulator [Ktedonobacterales bacterium]